MIIDCHTHLHAFGDPSPPRLGERLARLAAEMDRNGVARAVIITSHFAPDDPAPGAVLDVIGADPRFVVVAGVDCRTGAPANLDELRGLLEDPRVRGLKLYAGYQPFELGDPALAPVYRLAARHGLPVMIHTGDTYDPGARLRRAHPLAVDELAVTHRDVTFVMCHVGNPWFTDAMAVLYKNENVVADISGLTLGAFAPRYAALMRARLAEVLAYLGRPDKLMFGTDWPICDLAAYLAFARDLPLEEPERAGLFAGNAARVFGLAGG